MPGRNSDTNSSRTILRIAKKKKNPSASFQSGRFPTTTPSTAEFADACELFPLSLTQIFICIKKCTRGERGTETALRLFLFFLRGKNKKERKKKKESLPNGKRKPNYTPLVLPYTHLRNAPANSKQISYHQKKYSEQSAANAALSEVPFFFSGREGERGEETEARLFITQPREPDQGRIEISELCQRRGWESISQGRRTPGWEGDERG